VWYEDLLHTYGALDGLPPTTGERSIRHPGVLVTKLEEAGFTGVEEYEEATELKYRPEMLLVEDGQIVQTLSA
jgi:hypothetical protein